MRRADQLIRLALMGEASGAPFRELVGRSAAWIAPNGTVHALKDQFGYTHSHWVKEHHAKIPEHQVVRLAGGTIDPVETKLRMMQGGWIRKSKPGSYEVFEPHGAAAVTAIRRHLRTAHPEVRAFKLDVLDSTGGASARPSQTVPVHTAVSDVATMRDLEMPRNWDAYRLPEGPQKRATLASGLASRARTLPTQAGAPRARQRRQEAHAGTVSAGSRLEERYLTYAEIRAYAARARARKERKTADERIHQALTGVGSKL